MSLKDKVAEEMKTAMRNKDKSRLEALRSIKSAILNAQTASGAQQEELSEDEELKLLQKLQKQNKDSLDVYKEQGREDLAETEKAQLGVIEDFLPAQMSEDELRDKIQGIIARTDAQGPQDMGKVMGTATKELAGQADGKAISKIAKEILSK